MARLLTTSRRSSTRWCRRTRYMGGGGGGGKRIHPLPFADPSLSVQPRSMDPSKDLAAYGYGSVAWKERMEGWKQKQERLHQLRSEGGGDWNGDADLPLGSASLAGGTARPITPTRPLPAPRAMETDASASASTPEAGPGRGSAAAPPRMTTVSRHYFGGALSESDHDLRVDIIENIQEDYGMFVWPCSVILAEYVWQQRSRFSGSRVVELGAGTSLPGLVAAKVGADVTLTDIAHNKEVLNNIRQICGLNNVNCTVLGLTWGDWDEPIFNLHPDIILGADVLYDSANFDDLFATVTFLLENSPRAVFITTYHNRSGHHLIEFLMVKWGLKCLKLLDGFSFLPSRKAASLQGNIQLVEIALDKEKPK